MSSRSSKRRSSSSRSKDQHDEEDYAQAEKKSRKAKGEGLTLSISKTGRVRKKSSKSQPVEEVVEEIPSEEEDEESTEEELMQSGHHGHGESESARRGRVRKKSAKVIEMEEFEEMEKKKEIEKKKTTTKKLESPKGIKILPLLPPTPASSKKSKSSKTDIDTTETPQRGGGSVIKSLLANQESESKKNPKGVSPVDTKAKSSKRSKSKKGEIPPSPVTSPSHQTSGEHELKLKFRLGASPSVEHVEASGMLGVAEEKRLSPTKIKIKKDQLSPMSPLHVQVPADLDPSMMVKEHDDLKMKLILSPKESPQFEVMEPHHSSKRKREVEENFMSPLMTPPDYMLEPPPRKAVRGRHGYWTFKVSDLTETSGDKSKKKKKKKDSEKKMWIAPSSTSPQLLAALAQAPVHIPQHSARSPLEGATKQKKAKKEKSVKKLKIEPPPMISASAGAFADESHPGMSSPPSAPPLYSDTKLMALKVQTSSEKKASKGKKGKKKKGKEDPEKPRKRRAPTAYMLWCNSYRSKVVSQNPGIDFATISKRLGEIWQAFPEKEKMAWKRKAKKAAAKGSTLISTGKAEGKKLKSGSGSAQSHGSKAQETSAPSGGTTAAPKGASKSSHKGASDSTVMSPIKAAGCNPVDIAAHLALLGESLSIIGARLQEHRGHIAVQGTMSVLLDSLLCALGPLTSLTTHIPQLNGCPMPKHLKTLDNIAYIMPGL